MQQHHRADIRGHCQDSIGPRLNQRARRYSQERARCIFIAIKGTVWELVSPPDIHIVHNTLRHELMLCWKTSALAITDSLATANLVVGSRHTFALHTFRHLRNVAS